MQVILALPTRQGVGLTSACLGLVRALEYVGQSALYYAPFSKAKSAFVPMASASQYDKGALDTALVSGLDEFMEQIVADVSAQHCDVLVVEGLADNDFSHAHAINHALSLALDAPVVIVAEADANHPKALADTLSVYAQEFGGLFDARTLGCILMPTRVGTSKHFHHESAPLTADFFAQVKALIPDFNSERFALIGAIPFSNALAAPRTRDIADHLGATWLNEGEADNRRVGDMVLTARTLANVGDIFCRDMLMITPADRDDMLIAVSLAAMNGVPMAGLVLTGGMRPSKRALALCAPAFATGLPIMLVDSDSYQTIESLASRANKIAHDDKARIDEVMRFVGEHINGEFLQRYFTLAHTRTPKLSPAAFRQKLVQRAKMDKKRIVLPEGDEVRTIEAASICQSRGIADCVLLGDKERIVQIAKNLGVDLTGVQIIDPNTVANRYVEPMVARRQGKLDAIQASEQLKDTVVLGTMMLQLGEVDGLVSGAVHTTANTVRPAFQLIKTAPQYSLVSSVFFMLLPQEVVVYGDCAINPNPNAQELAEIAIQSAMSAKAFGIDPKIAMISYSTGTSGAGKDVDKVAEAVQIVRSRAPQLVVDGPLQYDAASTMSVGKQKAPDSQVAGRANVFIFPDLNTGNTTYKAVQRSAGVVSVGPMLQGLNKPVNDLSRGALVDDIVYTIAITAIQAQRAPTS